MMHYHSELNQIIPHSRVPVTQIGGLLPRGNLHLNWTTSFHVHKAGSAAESNVTVRRNVEFACTPNGSPGPIPNILVMTVAVNDCTSAAVGDLFYTASDFPAAAGYRSQQQVSLLMGARPVDSQSKRQTDHSLHQQPSQSARQQPPELTPPVSLRCHHPGSPPRLT